MRWRRSRDTQKLSNFAESTQLVNSPGKIHTWVVWLQSLKEENGFMVRLSKLLGKQFQFSYQPITDQLWSLVTTLSENLGI